MLADMDGLLPFAITIPGGGGSTVVEPCAGDV